LEVEMSVKSLAPLLWAPPQDSAHGPVATAFLKVRQMLEALKGAPRIVPDGDDPQKPMEEDRVTVENILSDPAFWMFLNH